jgi:DNA-binding transcriptional ArsR family regulator
VRKYTSVIGLTANSLSALADPTRQRIVAMLAGGALSSGEIASRFKLSPPAVSQHLKTLRGAKLVSVRADKQRRIYQLNPEGVEELSEWIGRIRAFWNPRLDALEDALVSNGQAVRLKKAGKDKP